MKHFPECSHQQAFDDTLILTSDTTMINFIAWSVCLIRLLYKTGYAFQNVGKEIIGFDKESHKVSYMFTPVCLKSFIGRKKQSRNLHFRLLEYSAIFAPRSNKRESAMERHQLKQIKEAFKSLHKQFPDGQRDFSWCRVATFNQLCLNGHTNTNLASQNESEVDHRFTSEEAHLTFQKFRKLDFNYMHEASISTMTLLIQLKLTLRTIYGNSFRLRITVLSNFIDRSPMYSGSGWHGWIRAQKTCQQREIIPQLCAEHLKALSLLAASKMKQFPYEFFLQMCLRNGNFIHNEFSFCLDEIVNNVMDNSCGIHSLIFKYAGNGHYYVALKIWNFFEYHLFLVRRRTRLLHFASDLKKWKLRNVYKLSRAWFLERKRWRWEL